MIDSSTNMLETTAKPTPVEERIKEHLVKNPSAGFGGSVIEYTNQAIELSVEKFRVAIESRIGLSEDTRTQIDHLVDTHIRLGSGVGFTERGRFHFKTPKGNTAPGNRLLSVVYSADPDLIQPWYAISALPPLPNRRDRELRNYPGFNARLVNLMDNAGMDPESPMAKLMAVAFITQIGKNEALTKSRDLMKKALMFGGVASEDAVPSFTERTAEDLRQLRADEAFISKGLGAIHGIAEEAGWSEEHIQLILDLCFISNRGLDNPQEFKQLLIPLAKMTAEGNWEEAFKHRDFLLRFFRKSFPYWRRVEAVDQGGESFDDLKSLVAAVSSGKFSLSVDDIPQAYQEFFAASMPKKLERAERISRKKIVETTSDLSLDVLNAVEKSRQEDWVINSMGGNNSERVREIFFSSLTLEEMRDRYFDLVEEVSPDLPYKAALEKFNDMLERARNARTARFYVGGSPANKVRVIDGRQYVYSGSEAEFMRALQRYRQAKATDMQFYLNNPRTSDVGVIIRDLISGSHPEWVSGVLKKVFEDYRLGHLDRRIDFFLRDYVEAMVESTGLKPENPKYPSDFLRYFLD